MTHRSADHLRRLDVEGLARVEGEGSLHVEISGDQVTEVELEIFEPPRLFEALLVGRRYDEAPDITARVCGICPVAYQMSACAAMEDAFGTVVPEHVREWRRLLYCGEWIQSHALHINLLHAPDFLGYADAVELAEHDRSLVDRALRLKRTGNLVMETLGGRSIHPVTVRVGGFYRAPDPEAVQAMAGPLRRALDDALDTVQWVAGFEFPEFESDYLFVALRAGDGYPLEGGRVVSSSGLDTDPAGFAGLVEEDQVRRSTALQARLGGTETYLTGPLARYALNREALPELSRQAADGAGLGAVCRNPFRSIVVRAVELVFACEEALRLVERYEPLDPAAAVVTAGAGTGHGATEAPRGLLLHGYVIAADGSIASARIVPPTSQNQLTIEDDLRRVVGQSLELSDSDLTQRCEQTVRNHDPCISCAAHFLDVRVDRR